MITSAHELGNGPRSSVIAGLWLALTLGGCANSTVGEADPAPGGDAGVSSANPADGSPPPQDRDTGGSASRAATAPLPVAVADAGLRPNSTDAAPGPNPGPDPDPWPGCPARGTVLGCEGEPSPFAGGCAQVVFDAQDREIAHRTDADCDGIPERCIERSFDDLGRITARTLPGDCDTPLEGCEQVSYGPGEGEVRRRLDVDCDGHYERCERDVFEEGQLTEHGVDDDCDDTFDQCEQSVFDADGRELSHRADHDCDGSPEFCRGATYDDEDKVLERYEDQDCDDLLEQSLHSLPEGGSVVESHRSGAAQGGEDLCTRSVFDRQAQPISASQRACNSDTECREIERDDRAQVWTDHLDDDCDGVADRNCHSLLVAPPFALTMPLAVDSDCDGEPESNCYLLEQDDAGHPTRIGRDAECSGDFVDCHRRRYDAQERMLYQARELACDGVLADCSGFRYEADGGVTSLWDGDCDGMPERCHYELRDARDRILHEWDGCDRPTTGCVRSFYGPNPDPAHATFDVDYSEDDADCDGVPENCRYHWNTSAGTNYASDWGCQTGLPPCFATGSARDTGEEGWCSELLGYRVAQGCDPERVDEDGLPIGRDLDCDGTLDEDCTAWILGEDGQPIGSRLDADCQGLSSQSGQCTAIEFGDDGTRTEDRCGVLH